MEHDKTSAALARREEQVRLAASRMYDAQVQRARQLTGEYAVDSERLLRVFAVAKDESDRSAAILLFALAEDLMLDGFKKYLDGSIPGGWKAVTGGNGVLATAADRLMMLYLLCWIRKPTYADLKLLKSIRNRFAHHADVESFDEPLISDWIDTLTQREVSPIEAAAIGDRSWRAFTKREVYFMRATLTVTALVCDLAVGPISQFERVSANDVHGPWEDAPENVKKAMRAGAEAMLWCVPRSDQP